MIFDKLIHVHTNIQGFFFKTKIIFTPIMFMREIENNPSPSYKNWKILYQMNLFWIYIKVHVVYWKIMED